ncbi:MAG: 3-hydroxyacyl-CoA dehydrogenase NAD-binding domain-containing protein [Trichlorobacter sp.]|uniref:3-hydroxyacyl-CoA dehydrogenase family protein n=1 Tax=Trichlorobacter sp. TaxID=2911007 RepID=UPI00256B8033|nr:3-hydroxyacyl-CoA dehydrogenase NAD-binding domain-containing protein [Trichlorobacter sp.]MDK9718269.1 3-hydroxyacyl-CoA dehydrogenase NAD-binding domain-containing protein [Trichlorobacter sp.]
MNSETMLIGVAGAGSMGGGIAQLAAMAGFRVRLYARRAAALDDAVQSMAVSLAKLHEKGLVTEAPTEIIARVSSCHDLVTLSYCDLVIEAIAEQMELKSELLRSIGAALGKEAILASTTSSLSITALGQASGIPERFVGMHFMNPVPLMEVVELIAGAETSSQTTAFVQQMVLALGKQFVCSKDQPGFIITRLLCVLINEAFEMLQAGVASAEEIDTAMHLGAHHPMGPLALADMIGLDVILAAMQTMETGMDSHKYAAAPLLRDYVAQGRLGRKSGQGVYRYEGQPLKP